MALSTLLVVACGGVAESSHGGSQGDGPASPAHPGDGATDSSGSRGSTVSGAGWEGSYLLEISDGQWTEPEEYGIEIGEVFQELLLDVEVTSSGDTLVTVGLAHGGVQDTCSKTVPIAATAAPPDIVVGPSDFEVYLRSSPAAPEQLAVVASVADFSLENVLPDGDTPAQRGELRATVDMRELYPLFYELIGASPDTVCGTLQATSPTSCEPCADGAPYCATVVAEGLGATPFDGDFETVPESCPPTPLPD